MCVLNFALFTYPLVFSSVNLRLKKDVLTFVNIIADIVHCAVHHWGGQCNKNLGNAFVIIWRIGDEDSLLAQTMSSSFGPKYRSTLSSESPNRMTSQSSMGMGSMLDSSEYNGGGETPPMRRRRASSTAGSGLGRGSPVVGDDTAIVGSAGQRRKSIDSNASSMMNTTMSVSNNDTPSQEILSAEDARIARRKRTGHALDLKKVPGIDFLADQALIGYLKIIVELNRNQKVLAYRFDDRLTNGGTEEFKVRMGFGLHAGWAIEGAVGSLYKVDATYLSPHVNMAARLETSSRQYGVPLLASHNFFELMSPEAQGKCRRLDVVTVKGSEVPIGIYTYDALQDQQFPLRRDLTDGLSFVHNSKGTNSSQGLTNSDFMPVTSQKPFAMLATDSPGLRDLNSSSPVSAEKSITRRHSDSAGSPNELAKILPSSDAPPSPHQFSVPLDSPLVTPRPTSRPRGSVSQAADEDMREMHTLYLDSPSSVAFAPVETNPGLNRVPLPTTTTMTTSGGVSASASSGAVNGAAISNASMHGQRKRASYIALSEYSHEFLTNQDDPSEVFERDADMITLRSHVSDAFLTSFSSGVNSYLSGDWSAARVFLEQSDSMMREAAPVLGGDGPSLTLLRYMGEFNWQAPSDFKGFRPLTSK